jgi:hypothetical protein
MRCSETAGSFIHQFDLQSALVVSPEERLAHYERLWAKPGFKTWLANCSDIVEAGAKILRTPANSWCVGANIPGKARFLHTSPDSTPVLRAKRAEVAAKDYAGFVLQ